MTNNNTITAQDFYDTFFTDGGTSPLIATPEIANQVNTWAQTSGLPLWKRLLFPKWNRKIIESRKRLAESLVIFRDYQLDKAVKTDGIVDCPEHLK